VQVARHISPRRDFLRHNEKCAGGRRGRTRAFDNSVTRNGTRRAAKCIMPWRRLQRVSGVVCAQQRRKTKGGTAFYRPPRVRLSPLFSPLFLLSLLSLRSIGTHKWSQRLCRARGPFMKFIEVIVVQLLCNESRLRQWSCRTAYTRYVIVHRVSRMALKHDDSPSKRHFMAIRFVFSEIPQRERAFLQSEFLCSVTNRYRLTTMLIEFCNSIRYDVV